MKGGKMKNMIDITGIDLKMFIKKVYELSKPQGYGFLHYQEGNLTAEEAEVFLAHSNDRIAIDMDYVKGRACKMVVFKENGKLFIQNAWYDHTNDQLRELLLLTLPKDKKCQAEDIDKKHNIACNCEECRKRNIR